MAHRTKNLNQMINTVSNFLLVASTKKEKLRFYEQWLRLSSSVVAKRQFSSTDKKVDQIYRSESEYRFYFRCEVSYYLESWHRSEPCFSNIVRKGRDISTAAALLQIEFLTK